MANRLMSDLIGDEAEVLEGDEEADVFNDGVQTPEAVDFGPPRRPAQAASSRPPPGPAPSLSDEIVAPATVSSLGSLWKQLDNTTFEVPAGPQLAAFLFATGPAVVTRYNLIRLQRAYFPPALVTRTSASSVQQQWAHDVADVSMLTERGKAALAINPALRGYTWQLACSGRAVNKGAHPNCRRQCGGIGACVAGCTGGGTSHERTFHRCSFRVFVKQTLQQACPPAPRGATRLSPSNDLQPSLPAPQSKCLRSRLAQAPTTSSRQVADGVVRVTVSGFHVPDGVTHIPPPLTGLRVAPSIRRQVITDCLGRDTPGTSINKLEEQLPQGPSNSRFLPPAKAVSQVVKHTRRVQRGGSIDDATRLDRLVRQHLIQRAYVLL